MTMDQETERQISDRRTDQRHRTVFRPAYIRIGNALHFVTMRDVSHEGASFQGLGGLMIGEEVFYCVGDSEPILAQVKWLDGETFGVENVVDRIDDLTFSSKKSYRSVRLPVTALVQIYYLGCRFDGLLRNLSQTGACIDADIFFTPGELLTLQIGGVSMECAEVKWVEGTRTGIRFSQFLDRETISYALKQLQCRRIEKGSLAEIAA